MGRYYKGKRKQGLFAPESSEPFKLSRTKIELFLRCPLCFYLDRRLGVAEPPGYPFSLNAAVDHLLKKEFDIYRAKKEAHPLMKKYGLAAVPLAHQDINLWREIDFGRGGVHYFHPATNFDVYGSVDDVWVNPAGEFMVVDYKATSKDGEVNLDAEWQRGYKNQMEIYQWLLTQNGHKVSATGYFVYVNGRRDRAVFDGHLEFDVKIIPYRGAWDWVEPKLLEIKECLGQPVAPVAATDCDLCLYRSAASDALAAHSRQPALLD